LVRTEWRKRTEEYKAYLNEQRALLGDVLTRKTGHGTLSYQEGVVAKFSGVRWDTNRKVLKVSMGVE
jgi:hypothetical protein